MVFGKELKKNMTVILKLETCKLCPHLKKEQYLTSDSWDHEINWYCGKTDRPKPENRDYLPTVKDSSAIAMVAWPSEEPTSIPQWCPLRDS